MAKCRSLTGWAHCRRLRSYRLRRPDFSKTTKRQNSGAERATEPPSCSPSFGEVGKAKPAGPIEPLWLVLTCLCGPRRGRRRRSRPSCTEAVSREAGRRAPAYRLPARWLKTPLGPGRAGAGFRVGHGGWRMKTVHARTMCPFPRRRVCAQRGVRQAHQSGPCTDKEVGCCAPA